MSQSRTPAVAARRSPVRALLSSCHPVPTAAVTLIATGLAVLAGNPAGRVVLVALAVLAGHLSIGWCNDAVDAARDRAVGRTDKPVAVGAVPERLVRSAAVAGALVCVPLSLALGWPAGVASLLVVACGWAYNLGVKSTVWSAVPFAVAFGALPAVATLALPGHPWPAAWAVVAGALFGVSAHLANVLPDLAADAATGVRGLPHRLGARATAVAAPSLLFVSSLVILFGSGGRSGPVAWTAAAVLAVVAVTGAAHGWRRPAGRWMFTATVVVVLADVALFATSGARLV
ncbi:UbiA family prenyltransferase [Nakamurella endophytica]|uniref:Membrane protein n=1 Tax=Nakamurella endophytica TaxID=1748367 RepID=A0A917SX71_9ACTN|nr:UbiA family prenyltransferase [Nakamurella endophytica]GGL99329.1 membrane protein [Nakamurella endophytica]